MKKILPTARTYQVVEWIFLFSIALLIYDGPSALHEFRYQPLQNVPFMYYLGFALYLFATIRLFRALFKIWQSRFLALKDERRISLSHFCVDMFGSAFAATSYRSVFYLLISTFAQEAYIARRLPLFEPALIPVISVSVPLLALLVKRFSGFLCTHRLAAGILSSLQFTILLFSCLYAISDWQFLPYFHYRYQGPSRETAAGWQFSTDGDHICLHTFSHSERVLVSWLGDTSRILTFGDGWSQLPDSANAASILSFDPAFMALRDGKLVARAAGRTRIVACANGIIDTLQVSIVKVGTHCSLI